MVQKVAIITGSGGLIGSESCKELLRQGYFVVGIDNDMRAYFFGDEASTKTTSNTLMAYDNYRHCPIDIQDFKAVSAIFQEYSSAIDIVIHTAAQPSHDWAAKEPLTDFGVNAQGTINLLEANRLYTDSKATFIFTSTNKVYGDTPNYLPLEEHETRWEIAKNHAYYRGIDESMSIDQCKHSIFGASKVAADIMVQEYGRYFQMPTAIFRGGCLTGPAHAGAELHGFLAYLMKCVVTKKPYRIFGYKGKQVRDNIHCSDLVSAFLAFHQQPQVAKVYNIGGSRHSNCSMLEAIKLAEEISGNKLTYSYLEDNRIGDHIWYISDVSAFQKDYPQWQYQYNINDIFKEIYQALIAK